MRSLKSSLVEIKIGGRRGDPKGLVELAKAERDRAIASARRERDDSLVYDEVWCVFDVDEHARLREAIQLAYACGIKLAVSNPCFELWILIHFRDQWAYISGGEAQSAVRNYIRGYGKTVDFPLLAGKGAAAIRRARKMDVRADENGDKAGNPSTGVWRLVSELCQHANVPVERL